MHANTLESPTTQFDLNTQIGCQYGQQNILDDVKCLLDCDHEPHAPKQTCAMAAEWVEVTKCHPSQLFLCDNHSATIKLHIDLGRVLSAKDGEKLTCFHCDKDFESEFQRI